MSSTIPTGPADPMTQAQREDLRRDVQAALEARRELGPAYDGHLAQQLTERMMAQVRREMASVPAPKAPRNKGKLDAAQRTAVAILSLIFGIPLIAVSVWAIGPTGLFVVVGLLALLNIISAL